MHERVLHVKGTAAQRVPPHGVDLADGRHGIAQGRVPQKVLVCALIAVQQQGARKREMADRDRRDLQFAEDDLVVGHSRVRAPVKDAHVRTKLFHQRANGALARDALDGNDVVASLLSEQQALVPALGENPEMFLNDFFNPAPLGRIPRKDRNSHVLFLGNKTRRLSRP